MRDVGPLIALIIFIVLTAVFGFFAFQRHSDLGGEDPTGEQTGESTHIDHLIDTEKVAIEELESTIRETTGKIVAYESQLDRLRARYHYAAHLANRRDGLYELAYAGRRVLVQSGQQEITQAQQVRGKITEAKNNVKTTLRTEESQIREKTDQDITKLQEAKDASIRRVAAEKKALDRDEKEYRQQRNYQQSTLDELKRQLDYLTSREPERADVQNRADGQVVLADPIKNTICINIGTAHGVRNGFRFECYAMHPGDRKNHKAYLEVRKASPNVSECLILTKPIELPKDPLSDYAAKQPEERYSPYQQSGRAGSLLQGLTAVPKKGRLGMDVMNPIVIGDFVQNPFFDPHKQYTFYIAGDKAIQQGQQKSAIAYQWPHIRKIIRLYGGKVVKKVDLSVDFMVAQKNPQDDSNFNTGVTLGIPVMYEWELFRFLDQQ